MPYWEVKLFVTVEADTGEEAVDKVMSAVGSVDLTEEEPAICGIEAGYAEGEGPTEVQEPE